MTKNIPMIGRKGHRTGTSIDKTRNVNTTSRSVLRIRPTHKSVKTRRKARRAVAINEERLHKTRYESSLEKAPSMTLPQCSSSRSLMIITPPFPFLQLPIRTRTTLIPSQRTQYWRASSTVRSPARLAFYCFLCPSVFVHSTHATDSRQTTPKTPCRVLDAIIVFDVASRMLKPPLYPFDSLSLLFSSCCQSLFTDP